MSANRAVKESWNEMVGMSSPTHTIGAPGEFGVEQILRCSMWRDDRNARMPTIV
jgi:hypothetical protein